MKAVHLICRRLSGGRGLEGLTKIENEANVWRSSSWAFTDRDDPTVLVGGWVYLHPLSKSAPSEFGGVVRNVVRAVRNGKAKEDGFDLIFEARHEGREQVWRGADYQMAWTSGIVEASLDHELSGSNAHQT